MSPFFRDFFRPINFVNFVIGVLGLFFAYYFYRAALPVTALSYISQTETIARLTDGDLVIWQGDKKLNTRTLYKTTVGVWNGGSISIEPNSIRRPFTIEFSPGDSVFNAAIVKNSHNVSNAALKLENDKIEIGWKYFDPSFYFTVDILHSGESAPQVSLRYIGDQEIVREVPADVRKSHSAVGIIFFLGMFFALLLISVGILKLGARIFPASIGLFGKELSVGLLRSIAAVAVPVALVVVFFSNVDVKTFLTAQRSVVGVSVPSEIRSVISVDPIPR